MSTTENAHNLTLGSLFSGSGSFELGGMLAGITPIWNCDVEPFPIRVTTKRLPFVKHYGDICTLDGGTLEPVDIITFGSPCQDMSIAGKRAGLDGSRSNLFYEAVRIAKEMRCATNGRYPKYLVWENVPGAFSSNGGEDFRCVLETLCRIKDETVSVPMPEKWANAGEIVGEGFSIAWRVLATEHFGLPQRRKRIYLVADLAAERAGQILFESEGLSGYSAQGFRAWQGIAARAAAGAGAPKLCLNDQGGAFIEISDDVAATLRAETHGHPPCVLESAGFCTEHSAKAGNIGYAEETSPTLRAGTVPAAVYESHAQDARYNGPLDVAPTVSSTYGSGGNNVPLTLSEPVQKTTGALLASGYEKNGTQEALNDMYVVQSCETRPVPPPICWDGTQTAPTLTRQNANGSQRMPDKDNFNCILQPFGIGAFNSEGMKSDNPNAGVYEADTARTLDTSGGDPSCNQGGIAVVFTQNQRDELRDLGEHSAALTATPGAKQQTFIAEPEDPAYCIQGSMIGRQDCNGPQGSGVNEDVSFSLNTVDRHGVYAVTTGSFTLVDKDTSPTLLARDYKDPTCVTEPSYGIGRDAFNQGKNAKFDLCVAEETQPTLVAKGCGCPVDTSAAGRSTDRGGSRDPGGVAQPEPEYTVRRLTSTECARLQGFPDWWCSDLGTENPTEEEIAFWRDVFLTHDRIIGKKTKPKTDKQIVKWLRDPHTDSAEYRMWGNAASLNVVFFVLAGVAWANEKDAADATP